VKRNGFISVVKPHFDQLISAGLYTHRLMHTHRHLTELHHFFETQFAGAYLRDEPLARHTWYRIGGPADVLAYPASVDDLRHLLRRCRDLEIPTYMLGAGANLLVSDHGYRGVIINLSRFLNAIDVADTHVIVQAGARLSRVVEVCEQRGLGGLEGLAGIPGTIGGALTMNAGASHGDIGDRVVSVSVVNATLEVAELRRDQIAFGYRCAPELQAVCILGCTLRLTADDPERLREFRLRQLAERAAKQPLDCPSCGSVFKRPAGFYVGRMVEDLGLKGARCGDAMISDKHGGFIINCGQATAEQVYALIRMIQDAVAQRYHVDLEPEVRLVGFEQEEQAR
jgi:UDP-N-acetylmuramate dehydrogenase